MPQLSASNSNRSQRPNCSSPLTDAHQFISLHHTQLNCTALTALGQSSNIALELTHRESHLQHFYCCVTSMHTWWVPLLHVHWPLPRNGSTCYTLLHIFWVCQKLVINFSCWLLPLHLSCLVAGEIIKSYVFVICHLGCFRPHFSHGC
jgi:hypothetical protein